MARVRITKSRAVPKAANGIQLTAGTNGTNGNHQFNSNNIPGTLRFSESPTKVNDTLQPVAREGANLEAERGETAVVSIGGLPAQFKIGGKRHSQGGTPLNLPDDSFIFSDTAKMKITDPNILAQFAMVPKKSGYTPAEIAKKYNLNKFRKILADPNTEDLERKTAEASISNCNIKLGKLALVQESMKGFPQGMPAIAMPYILSNNIDPKSYLPNEGQEEQPDADMGVSRYGGNMVSQFNTKDSTPLLKAQNGFNASTLGGWGAGLLNVLEAPQRGMMALGTGLFGNDTYEMKNSKTGVFEKVDEDKVNEYIKQGWTKTGKKSGFSERAHYEMPSETYKRTNPDGSPWVGGLLDIVADPFLVTGLAKSAVRLGTKKLINATSKALIDPALKGFGKEQIVQHILKGAGKSGAKNAKIAEKAYDAGANYLLKGKPITSNRYVKTIAKAAGSQKMINDLGTVGTVTKDLAKGAIKYTGKAGKYVGKKAYQAAEAVGDLANNPFLGPGILPIIKNVPGAINKAVQNEKLIKKDKELEQAYKKVIKINDSLERVIKEPKIETVQRPNIFPAQNEGQLQDSLRIAIADQAGTYSGTAYGRDPATGHVTINGQIQPNFRNSDQVSEGTFRPNVPKYLLDKLQNKAYGGNMYLPIAQTGNIPLPGDPSLLVGKPKVKKVNTRSAFDTNPEYIAETKRIAALRPDNKVTQEEFDELNALAKKMGNQKKGPETKAFQEYFHKIAGDVAATILAQEPTGRTKLAIDKGWSQYDIRGNVDEINGPRTHKYLAAVEALKPTVPPPAIVEEEKKKDDVAERPEIERNTPQGFTYNNARAPWWLQDIISTAGAVGDRARIVKRNPWQATPNFSLIDNVKYDPTRELAANAEQANIANQGSMYFTDPRQMAAQQAATQGLAGKNAADIMGRYNNLNVGLANQTNAQNTAIKNQASLTKATLDTNLYDKNTAASDNFDIARKQATQNIRNSYIDAITNRANTANLNSINPNFSVNPGNGGIYNFTPTGKLPATEASNRYKDAVKIATDMAPGNPTLQAQILKDILSNGQDDDNSGYPGRRMNNRYPGRNS